MAGITLDQAEARLNLYLDAEAKILAGQRVEMDGKLLQRADLGMVQKGIEIWQGRVNTLTNSGRIQMRRVVPL